MAVRKILFDEMIFYTGEFGEFADFIFSKVSSALNRKTILVHINLRNYYYLNKDKKLKDEIKKNCLIVFDGIGMKFGLMLKGYGLIPDLNGTDLFPLLMSKISKTKTGVYLLGTRDNIIKKASENILKIFPDLNICGYHNGYFSEGEEDKLVEEINNSGADILLVGKGFPEQELFVLRNIETLRTSLIWNVGGLFDTLSGYKTRAPLLIRKIRLEWLYRLTKEPKRMLHRNTIAAFWSLNHIIFNKR